MRPADRAQDITRIPGEAAAPDAHPAPDTPRAARPDPLRQRLDNLPPGHPSSPHETRDTPRPQEPRSHDPDAPTKRPDQPQAADKRPADQLTDAEWTNHVADVRAGLDNARKEKLSTVTQYSVDQTGQSWVAERRDFHDDIMKELYAKSSAVPNDYKAIIAGGLPGAGKTTVLDGQAGIDRSQYLTINPDAIKEEMARRGVIPEIEGLSPMEASDLVHEESSYMARQLAIRAQADGKNVLWDITMSSLDSTAERINNLKAAGYRSIDGIFVDIPVKLSIERAESRHREDEDKYRCGEGLGGRYVPPEVTKAQADEEWGSGNRKTFELLKPHFAEWTHFDNSITGDPATVVGSSKRDETFKEVE